MTLQACKLAYKTKPHKYEGGGGHAFAALLQVRRSEFSFEAASEDLLNGIETPAP